MADEKISAMATLTAANLLPYSDYMPIVDVSEALPADQNKKIFPASITGLRIQGKTAGYTLVAGDHGTIINVTANSVTIATDPAATLGDGWWCWVWNTSATSSHLTTINPNGGETIDGVSTLALRPGEGTMVICDGTNFQTGAGKKLRSYAENTASNATRPVVSGENAWANCIQGTASGTHSYVLGNNYNGANTASGEASVADGTGSCTASAAYSKAEGAYAVSAVRGKKAYAQHCFSSTPGNAQNGKTVLLRQSTDATPVVLTANASAPGTTNIIILPNDSTYVFSILVVARRTDADDESAGYKLEGVIDRNGSAATTALVGTVTKTVLGEDTAAWDVDATADTTNGGLTVTATGENAKTVRWVATVFTTEVTG